MAVNARPGLTDFPRRVQGVSLETPNCTWMQKCTRAHLHADPKGTAFQYALRGNNEVCIGEPLAGSPRMQSQPPEVQEARPSSQLRKGCGILPQKTFRLHKLFYFKFQLCRAGGWAIRPPHEMGLRPMIVTLKTFLDMTKMGRSPISIGRA